VAGTAGRLRLVANETLDKEIEEIRMEVALGIRQKMADAGKKHEEYFEAAIAQCEGDSISAEEFFALIGQREDGSKLDPLRVGKLFDHLDDRGEGKLGKEEFTRCVRRYYKSFAPQSLSDGCNISGSKTIRRLDAGEILEMLENPVREEKMGVQRLYCRAMKDGLLGWATLAGTAGMPLLRETPTCNFKVVQDTILTNVFSVTTGKTIRKLHVGETVELMHWGGRRDEGEEDTGLTRLKGRVKGDGMVGWATIVGNQGSVFLELMTL